MKKLFAILAVTMMVAGATTTVASAHSWHHYRHHHGWGFRSSNAELRGNNANSASGRNSLTNPNVAAGIGK